MTTLNVSKIVAEEGGWALCGKCFNAAYCPYFREHLFNLFCARAFLQPLKLVEKKVF